MSGMCFNCGACQGSEMCMWEKEMPAMQSEPEQFEEMAEQSAMADMAEAGMQYC